MIVKFKQGLIKIIKFKQGLVKIKTFKSLEDTIMNEKTREEIFETAITS